MKIRKELWFGLTFMAIIVCGAAFVLLRADTITNGHLGLLMLALVVVAIMLGFPTAFTLMGMGMIFTWFAYDRNTTHTMMAMKVRPNHSSLRIFIAWPPARPRPCRGPGCLRRGR